ncbi:response regulator [Haloparvum sedimenti]|uniref:response regulator n=1 Tax=Haloparvum sedimenti TaxID=1678448 RepID=UPI00071E7401|nr:response regulator [Haloparvum sedimenti]
MGSRSARSADDGAGAEDAPGEAGGDSGGDRLDVPRADSLARADGAAATVPIDDRGVVFSNSGEPLSGPPITVLHVDDDDAFLDLTREFLGRHERIRVETATDTDDALDRLDGTDCVVSDFDMPGRDGLAFLDAVRSRRPEMPFILFTGKGSEDIASEAISAGVTDYLRKGPGTERYEVLANRITNAVEQLRAREAVMENRRRLSRLVSNLPGVAYRCEPVEPWPMVFLGGEVEAVFGHHPEALVDGDVNLGDLILDGDGALVDGTVTTALERDEAFELTYRLRRGDGEVVRVYEHGQPVYENGSVVALEGFIMDVGRHGPAVAERDGE